MLIPVSSLGFYHYVLPHHSPHTHSDKLRARREKEGSKGTLSNIKNILSPEHLLLK